MDPLREWCEALGGAILIVVLTLVFMGTAVGAAMLLLEGAALTALGVFVAGYATVVGVLFWLSK